MPEIRIPVRGHTCPELVFDPGPTQDRDAVDQVTFTHVSVLGKPRGGWSIAFEDLERVFLAAMEARRPQSTIPEKGNLIHPSTAETFAERMDERQAADVATRKTSTGSPVESAAAIANLAKGEPKK